MPRDTAEPLDRHYHYGVIARAIAEIDAADAPLSLETLAARVGLSPAHFQRVFTAWVGVSPKRYQQYLSMDLARRLLAERHTTLDTADALGLSGSGRLHDMFVTWEAMAPGDYARRGAGLAIGHGWVATPFGEALGMATDRGLCGLAFTAETGRDAAIADMVARWPAARHALDQPRVAGLVQAALGIGTDSAPGTGADSAPGARLHLMGAPFQIKVWEALLAIPTGHVTTYSDIARRVGSPKAVRAVGTAVGRNPISLLIPCHRALRKTGGLGGYHWGLPVKRAMLAWEAARSESNAIGGGSPLTAG